VTEDEQQRPGRRQVWFGVAAALLVIVVLAVVSLTSGHGSGGGANGAPGPSAAASGPAAQQAARDHMARRVPGDPMALGPVDAPVTVVEFADFQCPYCGEFFHEVQPTLLNNYVRTGKVRFEWRDFAFLGPESTRAAVAARAAARQGKFWPYHDLLYAEQHEENSGALTTQYLVGAAGRLGLDTARFQADMSDPSLPGLVAADQKAGTGAGITGTPAVLVNGQLVDGMEPLGTYQQAIDSALAKASQAGTGR
jgi:protein-disulfide isomerase